LVFGFGFALLRFALVKPMRTRREQKELAAQWKTCNFHSFRMAAIIVSWLVGGFQPGED